jgi:hypothetical protein
LCFYHERDTMVVMSSMRPDSTLSIRRAATGDIASLVRLAALDSAAPLRGDVLLAEVDGAPRAALSLHDGRVVADPFEPTAGDVALLRTRAALMHGTGHLRAERRGLRARVRIARA